MRTLLKQFARSFVQSYVPQRTTKSALKSPPTGVVFDATVVLLFVVLGIGLLVV